MRGEKSQQNYSKSFRVTKNKSSVNNTSLFSFFVQSSYNNCVKYVITVPAIWKSPAKQFMRLSAYQAGLASEKRPNQLIIALEPEAASLYCRRLKLNQLVNENIMKTDSTGLNLEKSFEKGNRYVVVDCGGGTVDITVHEVEDDKGKLREIYFGGGAFGSICIDKQFELILMRIFGQEFIEKYKVQYASGFVDLMVRMDKFINLLSIDDAGILAFMQFHYLKAIKVFEAKVNATLKFYSNKN